MSAPDTRQFNTRVYGLLLFVVVAYLTANLLRAGRDAFIITLNNYFVVLLAIALAVLGVRIVRQLEPGSRNRRLWLGLAAGWTLWAVAEVWWAVASSLTQRVPYPSLADLFWTLGYLPMYFALWARLGSLPRVRSRGQQSAVWALTLAFAALTIAFVLLPLLQREPSALLASLLNLLFPLASLALLVLVLWLLLTYQSGVYGQAWRWLATGFSMFALGGLLFSYVDTLGLYYPGGQANPYSTLGADVPYNLSFLVMLLGAMRMQHLLDTFRPVAVGEGRLALVPNTHLLVSMKDAHSVIAASRNYARVYEGGRVSGTRLTQALGIAPEDEGFILGELQAKGLLRERAFTARTRFGRREILVSGAVALYPQPVTSGIVLVVRLLVEEDYSLDGTLTAHERELLQEMLSRTGALAIEEEQIKRLLGSFYQAHLSTFYNLAFAEGGGILADAFVAALQSAGRRAGCAIAVGAGARVEAGRLPVAELQRCLRLLFETGESFAEGLVGASAAQALVRQTRERFGERSLRNVAHFETLEWHPG